MKEFVVDIHEFRDRSYTIGYEQGRLLDKNQLAVYDTFTKESMDLEGAQTVLQAFAPHLLEEIHGLADGLRIPHDIAMRYFSGYDFPKLQAMGCSSIVTQDFMVRNYDFSPLIYDHQLVFARTEETYGSVGYSLHYIGRHEGVNEHGVTAALHFVNNTDQIKGLMCSTIIRILADTCKTTDDCIQLLKELPHACSYNYSIGDRTGNHVVVEASPDKIQVRKAEETLICTNHFQAPSMEPYNRKQLGHSKQRLESMERKNTGGIELFNWFSDPDSEMFFHDYEQFFGTLHTFGYFFKEDRFITKVANGKGTLDIKLNDWINGKPLPLTKLTGSVPGTDFKR